MPSLKLFGQRTPFAGDDLRIFLVLHALFRATQIALAISLLCIAIRGIVTDEFAEFEEICVKEGRFTFLYSSISLVIPLCSLTLLGLMFFYSKKGTPVSSDKGRRSKTKSICNVFLVANVSLSLSCGSNIFALIS